MHIHEIMPDLGFARTAISNVCFYGARRIGDGHWVLVDAGMPGFADSIVRAAERRFGAGARPLAIVLTHGHFDHVGSLGGLLSHWDVPVYAHPLELPYLTGRAAYPSPDPSVRGGMAKMSPLFPRGPFDFRPWIRALPIDGKVPGMPEWNWIHTPGHTPGHVSLMREYDRALIAGDAFVTTRQEFLRSAITQATRISGPPAYYTPDWAAARKSVELLAKLSPELAVTGHGRPLGGIVLRKGLAELAREFDRLAVPRGGRYVGRPPVDQSELYASPGSWSPAAAASFGLAAVMAGALLTSGLRRPSSFRRAGR
jgi:glyoxylase-like metal-dependent hydrolase (beta-lactamase superfamily II)